VRERIADPPELALDLVRDHVLPDLGRASGPVEDLDGPFDLDSDISLVVSLMAVIRIVSGSLNARKA
jgi:hypothetical protein